MKKELLKGLSEEQIAKIKACQNNEEIMALAKQEGIELSDEQLEAVSGGGCSGSGPECPACGSQNTYRYLSGNGRQKDTYRCQKCDKCFCL